MDEWVDEGSALALCNALKTVGGRLPCVYSEAGCDTEYIMRLTRHCGLDGARHASFPYTPLT